MRAQLGAGGMDVTPARLGAVPGIGADGTVRYDLVDLADRYANAIRLLDLQRQGVIELDRVSFQVLSVGRTGLTPQQFIAQVEQRYQAAFAQGLERAKSRLLAGDRLRYPVNMPEQLQKGLFADTWAKDAVAQFLRVSGIPEGPGQIVSLNRWAYDPTGSGNYVRPDVLIDLGPAQRHWIDGKSTYLHEGVLPRQLRLFFQYTGSQTGTIATREGSFTVRGPSQTRRP
jgi:hypothetical protein